MKKFKKLLVASAIATGMMNAQAIELWEPHLPGVTEGVPAGALPPPGVYADVEIYTANYTYRNNSGNGTSASLNAQVIAPVLLWSTGLKVLGADYGVQLIQPMDFTNITGNMGVPGNPAFPANGHWGMFNTIITPGILGWHLDNNFHVKAALDINLPTASTYPSSPGTLGSGGNLVPAGNGYTSFVPNFGISWLSDGWNASANMFYAINTKNSGTNYQSGQVLQGDYTLTKSFGKWSAGLGAFTVTQTTADSSSGPGGNAAAFCGPTVNGTIASTGGCKANRFGMGPLASYTFDGGVSVKAMYNRDLSWSNTFGGNIVQLGIFIPLKF